MSELRLLLLHGLAIEHDAIPLTGLIPRKAQALLVYLAVTDQPHTRQRLAGLLWPDVLESSARTSLRTALAQLRKAIGDHLLTEQDRIAFDRTHPHWIDVQHFEKACRQLQKAAPDGEADLHPLREAVYLYGDGFLAGFPETDAALFEEWALHQRTHYHRLACAALYRLATASLARNDLDAGLHDVHALLKLDPLDEEAHRLLMQFYARSGNIVAALRQFEECTRLLNTELGIAPGEATAALAAALRTGRWTHEFSAPPSPEGHHIELAAPIPANLPSALTPLVGRDTELAELAQHLASTDARLITIVGPGGMGKTRLALAAAEHQHTTRRFPHGVYFVELAPLGEPDQIGHAIAEALRLPLRAGAGEPRTPRTQLLDYLRTKRLLLVLDSFDHLLAGAALVVEILRAAPGVKLLVTSRERLRLPGEQLFPLAGLDYTSPDRLTAASIPFAAQLFIQTARRIDPNFLASDQELAQILQLCRLVEGMPLGIELAAGWVELLTPGEIVEELRQSLDILDTAQGSVPARHRSMRALLGGAWQVLEQPIQAVLAELSLFRGGFTRTAAQQIARASLAQLSTLAGRSLIHFDRAYQRYALHDLLCQYGLERLAEAPQAEADARRRHGVYFSALAQARGAELLGAHQLQAIVELEREAENLRLAWQWAVNQAAWEIVDQAMDGLGVFYEWQGRLEDGENAFRSARDALRMNGGADTQLLLARALTWHSVFAFALGNAGEAEAELAEALGRLEQAPADAEARIKTEAFVWLQSGIQAYTRDDERARTGFTRSLFLYQQAGHQWGTARALSGLGQADADTGNLAGAETHYRHAIHLLRAIGDRRSEAYCLHRRAILLRNIGKLEEAVMLARASNRLYREIGDRAGIAWSSQILAECLNFAGDFAEAAALIRTAEAVATDLGDASRLANVYQEQAMLFRRMGEAQEAHAKGEQGLALARRLDQPLRVAACQHILAYLDLSAGDVAAAEVRLRESETILEASARGHELAIVYAFQAEAALAQDDAARARERLLASLRLSLRHRDARVFLGLGVLAMLLADAGRNEDALALFGYLARIGRTADDLRAPFRQWLAAVQHTMAPHTVTAATTRYDDVELWELVTHWIAELE